MSTSETITRTDLTNILNEVLPNTHGGGVYSGAWTSSGTSAYNIKVTNDLTLPKGLYAVTVHTPYVSSGTGTIGLRIGGTADNSRIINAPANGYARGCFLISLSAQSTVAGYSEGSSTVSYSNLDRGGIEAVQLVRYTETPEADYIVEQGTDGIWTYRKWNSGLYEAWTSYDATGLSLTTSSAGTYYSSSGYKNLALPSFSLSVTNVLYSDRQSQSSGVHVYDTEISGSNLRVWYRAFASVSNGVCGAYFEIKGRWK